MLKSQVKFLNNQQLQITDSCQDQLKWVGSRASGRHVLQISKHPGILSIINQDPLLDLVNLIYTSNREISIRKHLLMTCESTFWVGDVLSETPYAKNYFDTILIDNTLASIVKNGEFESVMKLLKPNGKVIVTQSFNSYENQDTIWACLLENFIELDKRLDSKQISWVGRKTKHPQDSDQQKKQLIEAIQHKINEKKTYQDNIIQQATLKKQLAEKKRLEDGYKMLRYLPMIKAKLDDQVANVTLTEEEIASLTDEFTGELIENSEKVDGVELKSFIQDQSKVAVVLASDGFYHKCRLNFSHQLTNSLLEKKYSVVYVSSDNTSKVRPVYNGKKQLLQLSLERFEETIALFKQPDVFLTSPKLYFAKLLGRLQWNRWSIYYIPEVINKNELDFHHFIRKALGNELGGNGVNQVLASAVEREVLLKDQIDVRNNKNMLLGYIGNLNNHVIDYERIKKVLDQNESITIELIGYDAPQKIPIRSNRLVIREYTHLDEAAQRIGKWSGGILPFHCNENASLQLMRSLNIPLLNLNNLEDYRFDTTLFESPEKPILISDLLSSLLPSAGGLCK